MPVTGVRVSVGKEHLVSMTVACLDLYFPRKRENVPSAVFLSMKFMIH